MKLQEGDLLKVTNSKYNGTILKVLESRRNPVTLKVIKGNLANTKQGEIFQQLKFLVILKCKKLEKNSISRL